MGAMNFLQDRDRQYSLFQGIFGTADLDNSGELTIDDVERVLMKGHTRAYLQSLGIDISDAWTLSKLFDADNSGTVDREEWIHGCMTLKGNAKAVHVATSH